MKQERQVLVPIKEQFCFVKIIYVIETVQVSGTVAILGVTWSPHSIFLKTCICSSYTQVVEGQWSENSSASELGMEPGLAWLEVLCFSPQTLSCCSFLLSEGITGGEKHHQ